MTYAAHWNSSVTHTHVQWRVSRWMCNQVATRTEYYIAPDDCLRSCQTRVSRVDVDVVADVLLVEIVANKHFVFEAIGLLVLLNSRLKTFNSTANEKSRIRVLRTWVRWRSNAQYRGIAPNSYEKCWIECKTRQKSEFVLQPRRFHQTPSNTEFMIFSFGFVLCCHFGKRENQQHFVIWRLYSLAVATILREHFCT